MAVAIAIAQTCPRRGDVPANIAEHLHLARVAAEKNARVVLFPELSLTGYELDLAQSLAFTEDDPRLAPLRDLAAQHSITLIVGAPVRLGARLYIGAFLLHPDRTVDLYTKQHLGAFSASAAVDGTVPPAERTAFEPGDRNPLLSIGEHTAAIAICADIGRPSHPQAAADRGATIYLASMFVIPSEIEGERTKLRQYAIQHRMLVAFANYGCPSGGLASAGGSAAWSASGEGLVELDREGPGVAIITATAIGEQAISPPPAIPRRRSVPGSS